jgi:hypothetical protein
MASSDSGILEAWPQYSSKCLSDFPFLKKKNWACEQIKSKIKSKVFLEKAMTCKIFSAEYYFNFWKQK